ncbi:carbohydrate kinase FGGY, putative [Babesia ovata]|uniref:Carbohydrate kinase FGGY, putative n=1 Tax=Babesia ovata TaxID=189622 RepID=A0A2H6K7M4_9APIC|nr:carbohydrate kinase FGGY, putative [Babesia ovata]GBE59001.1 carbohydrate kinase FGGY, putative [Babesia ovata]
MQLALTSGAVVDAAEVDLGAAASTVDYAFEAERYPAAQHCHRVVEEVVADAAAQTAHHVLRLGLAQTKLTLDPLVGRLGEKCTARNPRHVLHDGELAS